MPFFSSKVTDLEILDAIGSVLSGRLLILLDEKGSVLFRSKTPIECSNCTVCNVSENIYDHLECPIFELFKTLPESELKNVIKPIARTVTKFDIHKKKHLLHTSLESIKLKDGRKSLYLFSVTDQTHAAQMESDLTKQRELLATIVRSLPNIVFVKDLEGRFLACNAHCEELLGASEEEAIGKSDYDFFEPELANEVRKHDALVLKLGEKRINEEWLRFPDAHEELFETTKTPLYAKNGSLLGILGVSRQITRERELQEKLMLTQYSVDNATIPIFWIEFESGAIFYANDAACKSLGYPQEELTRLRIVDINPTIDEAGWEEHVRDLRKVRTSHFETRHCRKDGSVFPVEVLASSLSYENKNYNVAFAIDISERIQREQLLAKKEFMLRESQRIASVGSWELDLETNRLTWSDEAYRILGIDPEVKPDFDLFMQTIHPQDRQSVVEAYETSLKDASKLYDIVHRIVADGQVRYVHEQCETTRGENGKPLYSIGTVRDMTNEHMLNAKVEYLSYYDNLTKLPNQNLIKQELKYAIKRSNKSDDIIAVCFIDLDEFKYINDVYSHEVGDKILKEVAKRLKDVANDTYTLGRFGADEFIVIVEGIHSPDEVVEKLEIFLKTIQSPFVVKGEECTISASVGISLCPNDGNSVDDLIKFADVAMHQAKGLGRNRYAFYSQTLTEKMSNRMRLLHHMQESLLNQDFQLYYQPQISLETMQVIGFEALLRWNHPIHGMVSPNDFIPLAEESGLIIPLGKWVLQSACAMAKKWQDEGLYKGKVAVNVSGVQLDEGQFSRVVVEALEESGLEAKYLELEITESSLMGDQLAWFDELKELERMGVSLAMDDFGTGYSSLSYLRKMRLDVLKIDQSFVFDLPDNSEACTMAKAIVGLAQNMKMHSLAEGVETAAQLTFLKALGCEYAQGYHISKPLPSSNVAEFLDYWKTTHKF